MFMNKINDQHTHMKNVSLKEVLSACNFINKCTKKVKGQNSMEFSKLWILSFDLWSFLVH